MKIIFHIFFLIVALRGYCQPPVDNTSQVNGLESIASVESSLKIYPNPAKNILTINMRLPSVTSAKVSLHDMLGNEVEVFAENVSGVFEKTFDIHTVRTGIYFIRINYENGQSTIVRKIIVQ
ncbi:MAG: T9SS type A sorting domain-containing protein [Opitutaceae bacterium]|nr:T9SS type A sorting domain-containing protein [Cytophagales bacterium]